VRRESGDWVSAVLFAGSKIYWGNGGKVMMMNVINLKDVGEIDLGGGDIWYLSISRDGKKLYVGEGWNGRIYELATKKVVILRGHTYVVRCIIPGDGTDVITCSNDHTIRIWDGLSGDCKRTLIGHSSSINSILFEESTKRIYSSSHDKTIICWDSASGVQIGVMTGHLNSVSSLAFVNSTTIVSGCRDGTIKMWDIITFTCIKTFRSHTNWVRSVAVTQDGEYILSGSRDHTVKITSIGTGECIHTLEHHSDSVRKVAISSDVHLMASGGNDGKFLIHSIDPPFSFLVHEGILATTDAENKSIRLLSDGTIRIMEGLTNSIISTITPSSTCSLTSAITFEVNPNNNNNNNNSNNNDSNNNNLISFTAPTATSAQLWVKAINAVSNNLHLEPNDRSTSAEMIIHRYHFDMLQFIRHKTGPFKQRVSRAIMDLIGWYTVGSRSKPVASDHDVDDDHDDDDN
jgi:WD40 repeat protein